MSVLIGTLCLNEMQWLPALYEQHKNWPGMKRWIFVESADIAYARANPDMVSETGLSIDGTTEFLMEVSQRDARVTYLPYGFSDHKDPSQGKCAARQEYMKHAGYVKPEYILALDADEFFMLEDQFKIDAIMKTNTKDGVLINYHNLWRPFSIKDENPFTWEIVGKFWCIGVCKLWKWYPGLCYNGNHNAPYHDGVYSNRKMQLLQGKHDPRFIHMGFASYSTTREAKNKYYAYRGEAEETPDYVASRGAFSNWKMGNKLPNHDKIVPYRGPVPEVFIDG